MDDQPKTYDVRSGLAAIRRRLPLIVATAAVAALVAVVITVISEDKYEATATLFMRDAEISDRIFGGSAVLNAPPVSEETNLGLVDQKQVIGAAAERLSLSYGEVDSQVTIEGGAGPELIEVTASTGEATEAAAIANGVAEAIVAVRAEADRSQVEAARRSVQADLEQLSTGPGGANGQEAAQLRRQLRQLRTLALLETGDIEITGPAVRPSTASSPGAAQNAAIGGVAGLVIGLIAALLLERLAPRMSSRRDFEQALGAPCLGSVRYGSKLGTGSSPVVLDPAQLEAVRALWARLRAGRGESASRRLIVAGMVPGDGAEVLALALARVSAAEGSTTLLVDANLRAPVFADQLGVSPAPGLSDVLGGSASGAEATKPVSGSGPGGEGELLSLIPAGTLPPNPLGLLAGARAEQLVERAGAVAEMTIISVPPLATLADGMALVGRVDSVIVAGRPGAAGEEDARSVASQLTDAGAHLGGFVLVEPKR